MPENFLMNDSQTAYNIQSATLW